MAAALQEKLPMQATVHLTAWTLRQSGGAITVTGTAPDGQKHKVTQVRQIYGQGEWAFGFGRHGRDDVKVELGATG